MQGRAAGQRRDGRGRPPAEGKATLEAGGPVLLAGNPNCGKTTLFNALTGMRQKVANYPGVTVETKQGRAALPGGRTALVVDLPGTYSINPHSPDEAIAVDALLGRGPLPGAPAVVVCIVDATSLERSLYFVSQILDLGLPTVVALNMVDVAEHEGVTIDVPLLERELGVPVIPVVASRGTGSDDLRRAIALRPRHRNHHRPWKLPDTVERECAELQEILRRRHSLDEREAFREAISLLTSESALLEHRDRFAPDVLEHVRRDHQRLDFLGINRHSVFVESRYAWIRALLSRAVSRNASGRRSLTDRIDRLLTHRVGGLIVFLALMAVMFQAIFSWASVPMAWIAAAFDAAAHATGPLLPPGHLRDLIVDGAIPGVAAVAMFLPQIVLLFLFLGLLEDSGYMARAAFIMDRLMGRVGLPGKAFIPLLGSFACAIPGIMATRTIEHQRDRLATMLVAPLMSCSARIPVYTLLIAAFIPDRRIAGILPLQGLTLLAMYLLGLLTALAMAWLFKRTLFRGAPPSFLMELPAYRIPSLRTILYHVGERAGLFLKKAGTIILAASVVLWFLATFPGRPGATAAARLEESYAGRAGRSLQPLIAPLGFDWKIGIGLVSSVVQREAFVSTMATIFTIDAGGSSRSLQERMRADVDPATGRPTFTVLTAICLMVYYVLAMQCLSTVAIMRRETNGWRWPLFQVAYMTALAYGVTFAVYRAGLALGLGG